MLKVVSHNPFSSEIAWGKLKNFADMLKAKYSGKFQLVNQSWNDATKTATVKGSAVIGFGTKAEAEFKLVVTEQSVTVSSTSSAVDNFIARAMVEPKITQALKECLK